MSGLVILAGAFALLVLFLVLATYAPKFLASLGGALDAGADNAAPGSFGDGDCGGDGD